MTRSNNDDTIIIGIDPGTRITGYGVVVVEKKRFRVLDFGCIRPPVKAHLSDRYLVIFDALWELLEQHAPHEMAIETQFVAQNPKSALKLGIAQGVCLVAAKKRAIKIFGYAPKTVKCSVVGTGNASKGQLAGTISRLLGLRTLPHPQDAADALAIAICHAQHRGGPFFNLQKYEL
jgi:crossover junction endodeoxyribonuclease RuvC